MNTRFRDQRSRVGRSWISPSILCASALGVTGLSASEFLDPTPFQVPGDLSAAEAEVWIDGISSWRTPRTNIGAACADCHAPDAIDLAFINVTEEDIRRRAVGDGLGEDDLRNVLAFIELQRERHAITEPVDRFNFRPLQPGGGEVLPGETAEDRDLAFYNQVLKERFPEITDESFLTTPEQFRRLLQRLSDTNLRDIPIGIPLPRWVADGFNGKEEFGTRDEWVPSFASVPNTREYYQYVDQYLAAPTRANLYEMLDAATEMLVPQGFDYEANTVVMGALIERQKFFVMLLGQHLIRLQALGIDLEDVLEPNLAFREFLEYSDGITLSDHEFLTREDKSHRPLGGEEEGIPFVGLIHRVADTARKAKGGGGAEFLQRPRGMKVIHRNEAPDFASAKKLALEQGYALNSPAYNLFLHGYPTFFVNQEIDYPLNAYERGISHQEKLNRIRTAGRNGLGIQATWTWLSGLVTEDRVQGYTNAAIRNIGFPIHSRFRQLMDKAYDWRQGDEYTAVGYTNYLPHMENDILKDHPRGLEDPNLSEHERAVLIQTVNHNLFSLHGYSYNLKKGYYDRMASGGGLRGSADVPNQMIMAYQALSKVAPDLAETIGEQILQEIEARFDEINPDFMDNNPWFGLRITTRQFAAQHHHGGHHVGGHHGGSHHGSGHR